MDVLIRRSLWATFLLYLTVSYVNTARLASEFETNILMCNLWALAVEMGDVTLLLGTLKRKKAGKPYFGYMMTFLVSLAVSVAANGMEGTNTFLGNNVVFTSLHEFQYPWILPWLLGITVPALMLATSSMLADFSSDLIKVALPDHTPPQTVPPDSQDGLSITDQKINKNQVNPSDLFDLPIKELALKYNVSERTIRNWKAKHNPSNMESDPVNLLETG